MGNICGSQGDKYKFKQDDKVSKQANRQQEDQIKQQNDEINQENILNQEKIKTKEKNYQKKCLQKQQELKQNDQENGLKQQNNSKDNKMQSKIDEIVNEKNNEENLIDNKPIKQIIQFQSNLENNNTSEIYELQKLNNVKSQLQLNATNKIILQQQQQKKHQNNQLLTEKAVQEGQIQSNDKQKMRDQMQQLKKDVEKLKFGSLKNSHSTKLAQQIIKEEQQKLDENADNYFTEQDLKYYEELYKDEKVKKKKNKNNKIRWKEGQHLGSGSFGQVILGMNLDTGELMAIKQINRRDIPCTNEEEKKEMIEALELEIELYKGLSHTNIVEYMGTTKSKETLNIFLEYVAQGSISYLLQKYQQFNEQLAKVYMQKILLGLEYLHSHKVVHRDIKGANVLVDNQGVCKLADFGSCKRIYNTPKEGQLEQIKGTVNWMAPEVIKQQNVGRFSDIWSIGCTLLEMLTGQIPYHQYKNPIIAMYQIGKGENPPEIPQNLSPELKDFLNQCFQFIPEQRPNVRQLLKHPYILGSKPKISTLSLHDRPRNSGQFLNVQRQNSSNKMGSNEVNLSPNKSKIILISKKDISENKGFHQRTMKKNNTAVNVNKNEEFNIYEQNRKSKRVHYQNSAKVSEQDQVQNEKNQNKNQDQDQDNYNQLLKLQNNQQYKNEKQKDHNLLFKQDEFKSVENKKIQDNNNKFFSDQIIDLNGEQKGVKNILNKEVLTNQSKFININKLKEDQQDLENKLNTQDIAKISSNSVQYELKVLMPESDLRQNIANNKQIQQAQSSFKDFTPIIQENQQNDTCNISNQQNQQNESNNQEQQQSNKQQELQDQNNNSQCEDEDIGDEERIKSDQVNKTYTIQFHHRMISQQGQQNNQQQTGKVKQSY